MKAPDLFAKTPTLSYIAPAQPMFQTLNVICSVVISYLLFCSFPEPSLTIGTLDNKREIPQSSMKSRGKQGSQGIMKIFADLWEIFFQSKEHCTNQRKACTKWGILLLYLGILECGQRRKT